MTKAYKGEAGYISYQRRSRLIRFLILLIIPLTAYLISYFYFGTNKNMISVISMVGMLPACTQAVGVIMMFTIRPIPDAIRKEVEAHAGDLTMGYELYMTNYDKNTLLDAVAICGTNVVGLTTFKNPDRTEAKNHLQNALRADGFKSDVIILGDEKKFIDRLDSLNAHAEDLRRDLGPRDDARYPEDTYEEQMLHIIKNISL